MKFRIKYLSSKRAVMYRNEAIFFQLNYCLIIINVLEFLQDLNEIFERK